MKLVSFDFDNTLFFTPEPEEGKVEYLSKTGQNWPHRGWWGRSESLDLNIFDIPMNPAVYEQYLKYYNQPDTYIILATGRLKNLKVEVTTILNCNDLVFDEIHLNPGMETFKFKTKLFEDLIKKLNPSEFIMFDDRDLHLDQFKTWANNQDCKVSIIDAKKL
jgi:hypothetical protein